MGDPEGLRLWACALAGVAWVLAAARGPAPDAVRIAARGALAGIAAFTLALGLYAALDEAGTPVVWERMLRGGLPALSTAIAIGLVEEGAKLLGLAFWAPGGHARPLARATVAAAGAFAALEAAVALRGAPPEILVPRLFLAPVAHAALAAPLAIGLAVARARGRWAFAALGLAAAAGFHALSDLALAAPQLGRVVHGAALLGPALAGAWWLRRLAPALPAPHPRTGPAPSRPA